MNTTHCNLEKEFDMLKLGEKGKITNKQWAEKGENKAKVENLDYGKKKKMA